MFLLCYFLRIKRKFSTAFHLQTDGQIKRQNSTIKAYLKIFINWEQDHWARQLPIVEFTYNNAKNASIGHTLFELNCRYYPRVFFKEDVDPRSRSCSANELAEELKELIEVCYQNLLYAWDLQKRAHNKKVKSRSYASGEKVWLNSKYIKTQKNKKLKSKFFGPFQIFHIVRKQSYKLELLAKWKIYNVFHVSLLEQDTTSKKQVIHKALPKLEKDLEFDNADSKVYEIETIIDSVIYSQQRNSN